MWHNCPLSTAEEGNPRFPRWCPFRLLCPIMSTSLSMYCHVLLCTSGHRGRVFMGVVWVWECVTMRHLVATGGQVH